MKQVRCHSSICKQVLYFVSLFLAFNSNAFAYTTSEFFLPFQEGTTLYKPNYVLPRHSILDQLGPPIPIVRPVEELMEKLPLTKDDLNRKSITLAKRHVGVSSEEVIFQLSHKVGLFYLAETDTRCYFGYTQRSYWQTYTGKSGFFRAIDHQPECFIEQPLGIEIPYLGININRLKFGIIHQSNGEGWYVERGWDRAYIELSLRWKNFILEFCPWYSFDIPFQSPTFREKYNFDIDHHLGFYQVKLTYAGSFLKCFVQLQGPSFEGVLKDEDSIKKKFASTEVFVTFPITHTFEGMVYYFDGKGSTLALYNQPCRSVGFGIKLRR